MNNKISLKSIYKLLLKNKKALTKTEDWICLTIDDSFLLVISKLMAKPSNATIINNTVFIIMQRPQIIGFVVLK